MNKCMDLMMSFWPDEDAARQDCLVSLAGWDLEHCLPIVLRLFTADGETITPTMTQSKEMEAWQH